MRLVLVSSIPDLSHDLGSIFEQALNSLTKADASYRDRRRVEELPPERLRDMGLNGSARRPPGPSHRIGGFLW